MMRSVKSSGVGVFFLFIFLFFFLSTPSVYANPLIIKATAWPANGGEIFPSGKVPVVAGEDQTFLIIPKDGYSIEDVIVDGKSVGEVKSFTFSSVAKNHSIRAQFRRTTQLVTIHADEGIYIDPSGTQTALKGELIHFSLRVDRENAFPILIVDGAKQDLQKNGDEYQYALQVTGDHSVLATLAIEASASKAIQILDPATSKGVASSSSDGQSLSIMIPSEDILGIRKGSIIVSPPNDSHPQGLLRKVTSISKAGKKMKVQTAPATLEDALENGQIQVTRTLSTRHLQSLVPLKKGIILRESSGPRSNRATMEDDGSERVDEKLEFDLFNVVLYDRDGDLATEEDQIKASGKISLIPRFNFYMDIRDFKLRNLMFTETITQNLDLAVVGHSTIYSIREKVEIARIQFSPITIWVGWFPVVMVPIFTVNVGIEGSVSAGITARAHQEATLIAGLSYSQGQWNRIGSFSNAFHSDRPILSAAADFRGYVEPELNLMLYGMAGPYASVQGYLELEADISANPWWELYAGLDVDVGVRVKALSKTIADYQAPDVIQYRTLLCQAEGPFYSWSWIEFMPYGEGLER